MSTRERKDNIERLIREAAATIVPWERLQEALHSAELHGVPRAHVEAIVDGVFGVSDRAPDADIKASVLDMIDEAYRERI